MRGSGFLLFIFFFSGVVQAQVIKGRLVDAVDNKPLAGATLKLKGLKDSTLIFNRVSDSKGAFQFDNIPKDSFFLTISSVGYEEFKQIVGVKDSLIDLGALAIPK